MGLVSLLVLLLVPVHLAWSQDTEIFFNPLIGITDGTGSVNAWLARYKCSLKT